MEFEVREANPLLKVAKILSISSAFVVVFMLLPDIFIYSIEWKGKVIDKKIRNLTISTYDLIVSDGRWKDYIRVSKDLYNDTNIMDEVIIEYSPKYNFAKRITTYSKGTIKSSQSWLQLTYCIGGIVLGLLPLIIFIKNNKLRKIGFIICCIVVSSGFTFIGMVFLKRNLMR